MSELTPVHGNGYLGYVGGWDRDKEDFEYFKNLADESNVLKLVGSYKEVSFDPRKVMKMENQYNQGACQGHSITSVAEFNCYLVGIPKDHQLSRAYGYYETQRLDGISGDRGSTISGGVKLLRNVGIPEESYWPYPNRYNPKRPSNWSEVIENASKYRAEEAVQLKSYEGVRTFLGGGLGAITIGITWGSEMNAAVVNRFTGRGGGGHAIGLFSLSERKDRSGRPYVWMMNSWGKGFGNNGWSEWSPSAIEAMFQHRWTVAIGVSGVLGHRKPDPTAKDYKNAILGR